MLQTTKKKLYSKLAQSVRDGGLASKPLIKIHALVETIYRYPSYDIAKNGEELLMKICSNQNFKCIFDIGAHTGDWTDSCRKYCKESSFFAFDVQEFAIDQMRERFNGDENICVTQVALTDKGGSAKFYLDPRNLERCSALQLDNYGQAVSLEVPATTGDLFCESHELGSIDLLKIDVEGAEHLVLKGFSEYLRLRKVKLIQFEYGQANIESRFLLKDFYKLLQPLGYKLGLLHQHGVTFSDYSYDMEDFRGPNYVAVHSSQSDLISELTEKN